MRLDVHGVLMDNLLVVTFVVWITPMRARSDHSAIVSAREVNSSIHVWLNQVLIAVSSGRYGAKIFVDECTASGSQRNSPQCRLI